MTTAATQKKVRRVPAKRTLGGPGWAKKNTLIRFPSRSGKVGRPPKRTDIVGDM